MSSKRRRATSPPQSQPHQQQDQRVVAPAQRAAPVTRPQQRLRLAAGDRLRQRRRRPAGRIKRRRRQIHRNQPFREAETQQRPQPRHEEPRRADRPTGGHAIRQSAGHVAGAHRREATVPEAVQEQSCVSRVALDRALGEPPLAAQITGKRRQEQLRLRQLHGGLLAEDPQVAQHVQQDQQPGPRPLRAKAPAGTLPRQEILHAPTVQPPDGDLLDRQPRTEPPHLAQLVDDRQRPIPERGQLSRIRVHERDQRPRHPQPAHPARWPGHHRLLLREQEGRRSPDRHALCRQLHRDQPSPPGLRSRGRHNADVGIFVLMPMSA